MDRVEQFRTKSGSELAAHFLATGGTRTVVICHPTPGAGNLNPDPAETAKRAVTLVGIDRPGYGLSVGPEGEAAPSVVQAAADLAAVIEQIATDPVGVVGWLSGGWVAAALAARRPELVDRIALVSTPAPHHQVNWIDPTLVQMIASNQLETYGQSLAGHDLLGIGDVDAAFLADPAIAGRLNEMLTQAMVQGMPGMLAEIAGFYLPELGFQLADIAAKTLCLYGRDDPVFGNRHGSWWQRNLADARLEMRPNAGRLLLFPMWKRILAHLAPRGRKRS